MRNFNAVPAKNYIGTPFVKPLSYGGIAGIGVPLVFNWVSYGASTLAPNQTSIVDLRSKGVATKIIGIRSLYIDNMGSDVPIYVYFPDTQYTVVCQPNSSGWYKVYTGELVFWVVGLGFLTGSAPSTFIIATNLSVESAIDLEIQTSIALWKASATISRGTTIYNQNFGTPALGDQTIQYSPTPWAIGVMQNNLWGTPLSSGFIYLTHVDIRAGLYVQVNTAAGVDIIIESTGAAGVLYQYRLDFPGGFAAVFENPSVPILTLNNMNVKLDATQTWRMRCSALAGFAFVQMHTTWNWTTNPN